MDQLWIEAARAYRKMSDSERSVYWSRLEPEQKVLLQQALDEPSISTPPPVRPLPVSPKSAGCAQGCLRFLRRGCLTIILTIVLLVIWSMFPSFTKPSTDRFDLWPDSTKIAASVLSPVDRYIDKNLNKGPNAIPFPLPQVKRWLAVTHLKTADIADMSLLSTVDDGGGWSFSSSEVDFKEVRSPVAILTLKQSARRAFASVPHSQASPTTLEGDDALVFNNPLESSGEAWYLAAPTDSVLVIGGHVGVAQVLSVAHGKRNSLRDRRVLRPLLQDIEHAAMIDATFITPTQEKSMPLLQVIAAVMESIPGPSQLMAFRGKATAFEYLPDGSCTLKYDFQYHGRTAGRLFAIFLWLTSPKSPSNGQGEVRTSHANGLAKLEFVGKPGMCTDDLAEQNLTAK